MHYCIIRVACFVGVPRVCEVDVSRLVVGGLERRVFVFLYFHVVRVQDVRCEMRDAKCNAPLENHQGDKIGRLEKGPPKGRKKEKKREKKRVG